MLREQMMWATEDKFYNSMKWHLADGATVEEYEDIDYWHNVEVRRRVRLICPSSENHMYILNNAKFRDSLKLSQANICAYCKKQRMKELGILDMLI
jgi:hypothetical protein